MIYTQNELQNDPTILQKYYPTAKKELLKLAEYSEKYKKEFEIFCLNCGMTPEEPKVLLSSGRGDSQLNYSFAVITDNIKLIFCIWVQSSLYKTKPCELSYKAILYNWNKNQFRNRTDLFTTSTLTEFHDKFNEWLKGN